MTGRVTIHMDVRRRGYWVDVPPNLGRGYGGRRGIEKTIAEWRRSGWLDKLPWPIEIVDDLPDAPAIPTLRERTGHHLSRDQ